MGKASRSVTIYDVAKAAGVAPSTVSRTFSRPGRVNVETGDRIRAVAEELGYRTNPQARALSTTRTWMLAVVLADLTNPGFFDLVRGAEAAAAAADYTLMLAETQESAEREQEVLHRASAGVDGIVLTGSRMTSGAIRQVAKVCPVVVVNRDVPGVPSVITDIAHGTRAAAEHLRSGGHREVTYLAGPEASWPDGMRWRCLRAAGADLRMRIRRLGPFPPTVNGGVQAAAAWIDQKELRGTAVVAYNDLQAIGFIRAVLRAGGQVPGDVSVIGYDNTTAAELITPELTTVAAPMHSIGATAARHVLSVLSGSRNAPPGPMVLPTRLVVRGSTGPRNK